jgi:glycine/sarcosine N-methyltransferase
MRPDDDIVRQFLPDPTLCGTLLDCAAGIGTQAIALASMGYTVEGSDTSAASIERAQRDATQRGLTIPFRVDDVRRLATAPENHYGAAIAMDNVLPHLGGEKHIRIALATIRARLRSGGVFLTGIRDYDSLLANRPSVMPASFSGNGNGRRIFHEVWDWHDERHYTCHVYVTKEIARRWEVMHFTGDYCAILKCEMADLLCAMGFVNVQVLPPEQTGFRHPLFRATKP